MLNFNFQTVNISFSDSTALTLPWVPEGFFRSKASIVSGEAAIEILGIRNIDNNQCVCIESR